MEQKVAVGFDIGTTYSVAGVFRNGAVEIVPNDQGNRTTPSWVSFTETDRLIGEPAKAKAPRNPKNSVYDAKRLIGRKFTDKTVQNDIKYWPFDVVEDEAGFPMVSVQYKGEEKTYYPEEISSMVISKMKQNVEEYLGFPISEAVITVPAYFNDSQRQATRDAAAMAGLQVLRIINEPTAAALAYGISSQAGKGDSDGQNVIVADIGGK